MKQGREKAAFHQFVELTNKLAGVGLFVRGGLGVDDKAHTLQNPRAEAARRVEEVLATTDLPREEVRSLRELLMQSLQPFLTADDNGAEISMLDVVTLGLTRDEDIKLFLLDHGVDVDNRNDLQYLTRIFKEAIDFFNRYIARLYQVNPELCKVQSKEGIYRIFKIAAGQGSRQLIPQACGLLRIVRIIDLVERNTILSLPSSPEIDAQLDRAIKSHIKTERVGGQRRTFFVIHDPEALVQQPPISLVTFGYRWKERDRIIMKLLHKPSTHPKDIVDKVGIKFVTSTAMDTIRLIYYLFFNHRTRVLPAMNIQIPEGKNRLFEEKAILEIFSSPEKAEQFFRAISSHLTVDEGFVLKGMEGGSNPHTISGYKGLSITFELPVVMNGQRRLLPVEAQFFPKYIDLSNAIKAPHQEYVANQTEAVQERVAGNNLLTRFEERLGRSSSR